MSTPEPVTITVNDLTVAVKVIDLAVERGGFRGAEISIVGALRDRLVRFVEANNQLPAEDPPAPAPAPAAPAPAANKSANKSWSPKSSK